MYLPLLTEIAVIGLLMNAVFLISAVIVSIVEFIVLPRVDVLFAATEAQKALDNLGALLPKWRRVLGKFSIIIPFASAYIYFKLFLRAFTKKEMLLVAITSLVNIEVEKLEKKLNKNK